MTALICAGNLVIDRNSYMVFVGNHPATLTQIEFEVLVTLASSRGRVLSRRELLMRVWGKDDVNGFKKLAVHISRLRKKIAGSKPWTIRTVIRRGYALTDATSRPRPRTVGGQGFWQYPSAQGLAGGG